MLRRANLVREKEFGKSWKHHGLSMDFVMIALRGKDFVICIPRYMACLVVLMMMDWQE